MTATQNLPDKLKNIEQPFKIYAGPGAGKTTWLVKHIQNVLQNSKHLGKTRKIACISYTRTGANEIEKKVKKALDTQRLDIGTIHSFLYRNIIKPFSYLIATDENGNELFKVEELSGHIENRLNQDRFNSWKKDKREKKQFYLFDEQLKDQTGKTNLYKTKEALKKITWKLDKDNIEIGLALKQYPKLLIKKGGNIMETSISKTHLFDYKKAHWRKGIMHHEDVLFFTHYIFTHHPKVISLLANKFPYIFLDEFQDTNPLQTWIIKKIAEKGSTVGVIGDAAQAIYEFAEAKRKDFESFTLPNIQQFTKSSNFRSLGNIVDFLNTLRTDISQCCQTYLVGEPVTILVGDSSKAVEYMKALGNDDFIVLCRHNKDVKRLRNAKKSGSPENLIDLLYSEDSNPQRVVFIHSLFKAYDFYKAEEYKNAIKEVKKHLKSDKLEGLEKREVAIRILEYLSLNTDKSINDIYSYWQTCLKNSYQIGLKKIVKQKDSHQQLFIDFIPFLRKETKIVSKIKSIHQSKGEEFDYVLVCLFKETKQDGSLKKDISGVLKDYIFDAKTNITKNSNIGENTRMRYVAFSRAKKRLYICIPSLTPDDKVELQKLKLKVEVLQKP